MNTTARSRRPLQLGAVLVGVGDNSAPTLWRDPDVPTTASIEVDWYVKQAREAEDAAFGWVFIVDSQYIDPTFPHHHLNRLEPTTVLSAVAMTTSRIGLVATVSTTYTEPWDAARKLGSLDLISHGRAGWNIVTSQDPGTAGNFGRQAHEDYPTRHRRALENVETAMALWDSYEPGAFTTDKTADTFLDASKQHRVDHVGEFYSVTGPLNMVGSEQGRPVLFQAGSSNEGRDLGARIGDVAFNFCPTLADARDFRDDMLRRVADAGRDPEDVLVVPGLTVLIDDTDELAEARHEALRGEVDYRPLWFALQRAFGGIDLSEYDLDAPFPDLDASLAGGSYRDAAPIKAMAQAEGLTLRQVLLRLRKDPWAWFVGTASTVADRIVEWYEQGAADGFNLFVASPADWERFRNEVVPILVERGVHRAELPATTLRENLGLPEHVNRHTRVAAGVA
jgi:FMN-dependent oxidoreductase (nitrilotriacetate monooxygenase family)